MKKVIFTVAMLLGSAGCLMEAQLLERIKNKINQKANETVDNSINKVLNGKPKKDVAANDDAASSGYIFEEASKNYKFVPGSKTIFDENFAKYSVGSMPGSFKTSGSGEVIHFANNTGNWLLLKEFTTYKLKSDVSLPENFTIEFDIATNAREAKDLTSFSFGFAHDNSISNYIGGAYGNNAITDTQIHYWNKNVTNNSSDTSLNNTINFPLAQYAVGTMHVAIAVQGTNMQVYLDKVKVLDTEMFLPQSKKKYFYCSTSTQISHNGQIGISNFKIRGL